MDEYVENKDAVQKSNMNKGVICLFFKNSEFNIVPKAFNSWREFVIKRRRIREVARFVLNSIHHPL